MQLTRNKRYTQIKNAVGRAIADYELIREGDDDGVRARFNLHASAEETNAFGRREALLAKKGSHVIFAVVREIMADANSPACAERKLVEVLLLRKVRRKRNGAIRR